MALGWERALAEYLSAKGYGGLYDDPDPAERVIFVDGRAPANPYETAPSDIETSADAMIMIANAGGSPPGVEEWRYSTKIETRHPNYEDALELAHGMFNLLNNNGGAAKGVNTNATGDFSGIKVIEILGDFPPYWLGVDDHDSGGRAIFTETFTVRLRPFNLS